MTNKVCHLQYEQTTFCLVTQVFFAAERGLCRVFTAEACVCCEMLQRDALVALEALSIRIHADLDKVRTIIRFSDKGTRFR